MSGHTTAPMEGFYVIQTPDRTNPLPAKLREGDSACRKNAGKGSSFFTASPAPAATASTLRRWTSSSSAQSPLCFASLKEKSSARSLVLPLPTRNAVLVLRGNPVWRLDFSINQAFSVSSSCCHRVHFASLGIIQAPRGEKQIEPILGPSGRQLRLNCWVKKRR